MTMPTWTPDRIDSAKRLYNLVHHTQYKIIQAAHDENRSNDPPTDQDYIIIGKAVMDFVVQESIKSLEKSFKTIDHSGECTKPTERTGCE